MTILRIASPPSEEMAAGPGVIKTAAAAAALEMIDRCSRMTGTCRKMKK